MTILRPRAKWADIWFCFLSRALFVIVPIYLIKCEIVSSWAHKSTANDWSIIIFLAVGDFGAAGFYLEWILRNIAWTQYEPAGIRVKELYWERFMPWSEVTSVTQEGFRVCVAGNQRNFYLSTTLVSNWGDIAHYIQAHVPPEAFHLSKKQIAMFS